MVDLKYEDLIEGEIYVNYSLNYKYYYIFKYINREKSIAIRTREKDRRYSENYSVQFHGTWAVKHATQEEKNWLNACIEADEFVPLNSIKPIELEYDIW